MTETLPGELPPEVESANSAEPTPASPAPSPRRGVAGLFAVLALLGIGAAALLYWQTQQQRAQNSEQLDAWRQAASAATAQGERLATELEQLRERQRGLEQRISELGSANRVLREELFGVGERAAALEDALTRLAQSRSEGAHALKLDEIDFLLQLAAERLQLFHDLPTALRTLATVEASLDSLQDPLYAGLRQTLQQEIAQLRAHGGDARPALRNELGALQRLVGDLPTDSVQQQPAPSTDRLLRALDQVIKVRRLDPQGTLLTPLERAARRSALDLQLALAQAALERPDHAAWSLALDQALVVFDRLFTGEAAARARSRLQALRETPLLGEPPALGATLLELRNLRATRRLGSRAAPTAPLAEPSSTPVDATDAGADPGADQGPELERE